MGKKLSSGEHKLLRDEIDARRWRFLRDRYVCSVSHQTNGTSCFTIVLPRVRGNTVEDVLDKLMGGK